MKVTRKRESLDKILKASDGDGGGEISPSLMLRDLPKPIEGLEAGQDFEGHIKGKCRGHECRSDKAGGKETHHYDLDVTDFDHQGAGNGGKKKKSSREEVEEAFKKYGPDSKKEEKKEEKSEAKK
jgi:hypothetical protein